MQEITNSFAPLHQICTTVQRCSGAVPALLHRTAPHVYDSGAVVQRCGPFVQRIGNFLQTPKRTEPAIFRTNEGEQGMRKKELVDFFAVEEHQRAIHARLENWAAWGRNRYHPACAPGFELYRSSDARREYGGPVPQSTDIADAACGTGSAATALAMRAAALSWCYVTRSGPRKACQRLATTAQGLYLLVRDGRQMLINRGA